MKNIICSAHHSAEKFTWIDGNGAAYASDLKDDGLLMGQVWNDSCDVGFMLRSPKSGIEKVFMLVQEFPENGGWLFREYNSNTLGRITVTIFND